MAKQALAWQSSPMHNTFWYQIPVKQLLNYAGVGLLSNGVGYAVYLLATWLGTTPKLTMSCLYGAVAAVGYIGNRRITFEHQGSMAVSGFRYFLAQCAGYLLNFFLLCLFVDHLGYPHQLVQAAAMLVVATFLFIINKYFVFTKSHSSWTGNV